MFQPTKETQTGLGILIVSKWWQIFQFWMNYAFNIFVETLIIFFRIREKQVQMNSIYLFTVVMINLI